MAVSKKNKNTKVKIEVKKEEVVVAKAPTTKVCDDCAMEIPIAAKKCAHCGNTAV